ncbi:hypothetical protein F5883DRAFT_439186 [Diaporthe sp. PMI_573]|nr:hypothetical protein F5883DRAFT_439186 [Diaporthaceae sp. PMI_573]
MERVIIKPAIPEPPAAPPLTSLISFRHPGYDSPHDILFRLPRLDRSQKPTDTGVHHRTALVACQIVADNAFGGYLATDREGVNEVVIPHDAILTEDNYWFIASRAGSNSPANGHHIYPITPRFEDWVFPHERFAALGSTTIPLGPPPLPSARCRRCVISNTSYALHKCHIIPSAQAQWFTANAMVNYGHDHKLVNDGGNIVHMQHNLHSIWDDNVFALVPKGDTWTIHVLAVPTYPILEFADAWHNVSLRKGALDGNSEAYLFAKFAQAVFMLLKPFVAYSAVDRYVARLQAQVGEVRHGYEVKKEWLPSSSLISMYGGGGSRSASASSSSSRKRSRSQASVDQEDEEDNWYDLNVRPGRSWASWASDSEDSELEESRRGRPRKRRCRRERSANSVDTMPSLTDTSIADVEDEEPGSEDAYQLCGLRGRLSGGA